MSERPLVMPRAWTRAVAVGALLLGSALQGAGASTGKPELLVVVRLGTGAYQQAVDGLRAGLAEGPLPVELTLVDLAAKDSRAALARKLNSGTARVVVSIGPEALEVLASGTRKIPLISTLLLQSDAVRDAAAPAGTGSVATLSLDVPFEAVLKELQRAFPGKTRIGILRNPAPHPLL